MKKYFSAFLVLCSLIIWPNVLEASLLDDLLEAAQETQAEREREGPILAPTLIPQAKFQSQLGSYLVEQLRIKQEEESSKKKEKRIKNDIRKIEKSLKKLDSGISGWEKKDYSSDLDRLTKNFSKHTKRHESIVEVERARLVAAEKAEKERVAAAEKAEKERVAAAKRAERRRLAALEKAKLEKLAAYTERCEGGVSDDPFASFDAPLEPRMDLVVTIGRSKMKLQATNSNCLWLGNYGRPDLVPTLITEENYQQNPKNQSQYVLKVIGSGVTTIDTGKTYKITSKGQFVLDFKKNQCLYTKTDGARTKLACDDGSSVSSVPAEMDCQRIKQIFSKNMTAAVKKYGAGGMTRYTECLLE
jgi:hypothetical protein